jgi:hypothetical protein
MLSGAIFLAISGISVSVLVSCTTLVYTLPPGFEIPKTATLPVAPRPRLPLRTPSNTSCSFVPDDRQLPHAACGQTAPHYWVVSPVNPLQIWQLVTSRTKYSSSRNCCFLYSLQ